MGRERGSDSDTEVEDEIEEKAEVLNAHVAKIWRRQGKELRKMARTAERIRYRDRVPVPEDAPPRVQRNRMVKRTGLRMCKGCEEQGKERCSRMTMRGYVGGEKPCERCRRLDVECEDAPKEKMNWEGMGEKKKGKERMEVIGGRVEVVEEGNFAPRRKTWDEE